MFNGLWILDNTGSMKQKGEYLNSKGLFPKVVYKANLTQNQHLTLTMQKVQL